MDVLTWTIERRMNLAERAELLRKEVAEIEVEVARLEAAEIVFGQWAEATDAGRLPSGIIEPEPEPVVAGPGAGGMRLVPDRVEGTGVEVLTPGVPADHRRRWSQPVRGQLRKLADRGWLSRTGAGRYLTR
ncbi:hypothetical protein [Streptomyces sp. TP-A0356]|uniref:hypothetical protein n=1 Tax=Streptomyces sp. TP-A0356 TaxID=1359208 RepID=UPI0006E3D8DD|nr:hypothetical protein [Streptomyces sp. TP-A0356]